MKYLVVVLALVILCWSMAYAQDTSEEITLTTYYPAPYGEYNSLSVGSGYTAPANDGDLVIEGNVGIGTTSPASSLHVNGRDGIRLSSWGGWGQTYSASSQVFGSNIYVNPLDTVSRRVRSTNTHPYYGHAYMEFYGGDIVFNAETAASTADDIIVPNERMRIDGSNGNVGIGTTGPGGKFHAVAGASQYAGVFQSNQSTTNWASTFGVVNLANADATANNHATFTFSDAVGGASSAGIVAKFTDRTNHYGDLSFFTKGTDGYGQRVYIQSNGNVGIGTTNPQAKLDVNGAIRIGNPSQVIPGALYTNISDEPLYYDEEFVITMSKGADTTRGDMRSSIFIGPMSRGPGRVGRIQLNAHKIELVGPSGADPLSVRFMGLPSTASSGQPLEVFFESGDGKNFYRLYRRTSSRRYKDKIRLLKDDFTKILKVEPKSFIDKTTGRPGIGFIAEDLDALGLKNLVVYNDAGQPESIAYGEIPVYIIEVLKAQQKEIESLKKEVSALKVKKD